MGQKREIRSYSEQFKRFVVEEVEKGNSKCSVASRYGVSPTTVSNWLRSHGRNHLLTKKVMIMKADEVDEMSRLKKELRDLKVLYADAMVENKCMKKMMELADERYGMELKKNFDRMLSERSKGK